MKKTTLYAVALVVVLALLAGVLVWIKQQEPETVIMPERENEDAQNNQNTSHFVTDVDPDVSHWQTKETEFFTIKFPKEWYWLESNLEKTGYHSMIITNNPEFPIDKYADIGIFTGGDYPMIVKNDSEIIISTNNLGWVTANAGSPYEFMESEINRVKKNYLNPSAECNYVSNLKDVPLIVKCSYIDSNNQKVITYYSSQTKRTFAYSARMAQENNLDIASILEQIARSFVQKKDF